VSVGDSFDPEALASGVTIWAAPGVVVDDDRPDLGTVAVLTAVPSITVHTSDAHLGAEVVDVILSGMLESGFALVVTADPAELAGLPLLPGWEAVLDAGGQQLQVLEPGGSMYDGDLGEAVPPGWHDAVRRRARLVILVGSAIDLWSEARTERIAAARRSGRVVGAQVPLRVAPGSSQRST
jgi:hypothetical protein